MSNTSKSKYFFFVTHSHLQLVLFGTNQFDSVKFLEENTMSFEHIFLNGWDTSYDSDVYPKTRKLYALYEIDSFFQHVDHVVLQVRDY